MKLILLAQVWATLFMVGLIWFVQVVHYPLFAHVGRTQFPEYERLHNQFTTWIVGPVMLLELTTAMAFLKDTAKGSTWLPWLGAIMLFVIWITTATLSVPAHNSLASAFSPAAYQQLVSTNWIRTVAWTARGFIVIALVYRSPCGKGA